jgi:hypothetical protein
MAVSMPSKNHSSIDTEPGYLSRPLLWLNLFCLGAPLVALGWQWLFGRVFHVEIPIVEHFALFLTVWLIYLTDRVTGAISSAEAAQAGKVREDFSFKHRRTWLALISLVAVADAITAFFALNRPVFFGGLVVGALVFGYTLTNFFFGRLWRTIPVKEMIVGAFFAIGTALSIWTRVGASNSHFVFALALFACLCALNSMSIAFWECDLDLARGFESIATCHPTTQRFVRFSCLVCALASLLLSIFHPALFGFSVCLLVGFVCLFILPAIPMRRDERTALADLVLLAPLPVLLLEFIL